MVSHEVSQVLHRQLGITDDELSLILVESHGDVEQVRGLGIGSSKLFVCTEELGDLILFRHEVSVHSVHRDVVVIVGRLRGFTSLIDFLDVVRFKDLIFVEREGILDSHVLDVGARGEVLFIFLHVFFFVRGLESGSLKVFGFSDEL